MTKLQEILKGAMPLPEERVKNAQDVFRSKMEKVQLEYQKKQAKTDDAAKRAFITQ